MKKRSTLVLLLATAAAALVAAQAGYADRPGDLVFVQTNELNGNQVVVYDRGADGTLTRAGTYPTGGLGGAAAPGTESDRLASQGSLAYDARHRLVIAVNAGSDTVSSFRVSGDRLTLANVVPSGGQFPASITVHNGLAYVLNSGGAGTVQGFRVSDDGLHAIPGSARTLGLANTDPPFFLTSPSDASFLYAETGSAGTVDEFRAESDGSLTKLGVVTGLPPGIEGIAAT